ncbi:hypothetical protein GCM10008018_66430 [Paenibacillus marchantiophytorum]|uniref:Uncharacterized protein n=1 Tax=Paenibacillus marchantiophytorum TaxID=1619310 RepID=A0ABQ1FH86_9BACL|nr:hypothetical protein [Paenibacillus marchantiophytorum]GGA12042.1 hypothetical protein GCM10008018_66430 [Paenibacillus marchantiophytorum]
MASSRQYYLGLAPDLLNPHHLAYEWFGVLWLEEDHHFPVIVGYWFSKDRSEILHNAILSGFTTWKEKSDHFIIMNMYQTIRRKQSEQDWIQRSRLSIRTLFTSPWKETPPGLYIIKSRDVYPLHASAVCKKKFFVWLEHAAVCETEKDLQVFTKKVHDAYTRG